MRLLVCALSVAALALMVGCAGASGGTPSPVVEISSAGSFTPAGPAKAGVPLELRFGPGAACTAAIQFKDFGVYEDLTDGGGVVKLPPLQPGDYPLLCQSEMVMGVLEVR